MQVDWLSQASVDYAERCLHLSLFQLLADRFGLPMVDLFASQNKHQILRFFTRFPTLTAEAVDALHSPWPPRLLYAFPPLQLIPRVIRKMLKEEAELIF